MKATAAIIVTSILLVWCICWGALCLWVSSRRKALTRASHIYVALTACALVTAITTFSMSLSRSSIELKYEDGTDPTFVPLFGVPLRFAESSLKKIYSILFTYILTVYIVKAAFIAMYFDLSSHLTKRLKLALWFAAGYVFLTFTIIMISTGVWCKPGAPWALDETFCNPVQHDAYNDFYTVLNVTSDFVVMLVPIFIVRTLQLRRGETAAIAFLLFLGLLTMIATSSRAGYLMKLPVATVSIAENPGMLTSNIHIAETWSFCEVTAAITALCLPTLRALLLKRQRDNSRPSYSGGSKGRLMSRSTGQYSKNDSALRSLPSKEDYGHDQEPIIPLDEFNQESKRAEMRKYNVN